MSNETLASVKAVVTVSSNEMRGCPICRTFSLDGPNNFEAAVNHLLGHGLSLLHVGRQDIPGHGTPAPYSTTVAVLGNDKGHG